MRKKTPPLIPTVFAYSDPLASTVHIAGSFNEWKPCAFALMQFGDGESRVEMPLPGGGTSTSSSLTTGGCRIRPPRSPCPIRTAATIPL